MGKKAGKKASEAAEAPATPLIQEAAAAGESAVPATPVASGGAGGEGNGAASSAGLSPLPEPATDPHSRGPSPPPAKRLKVVHVKPLASATVDSQDSYLTGVLMDAQAVLKSLKGLELEPPLTRAEGGAMDAVSDEALAINLNAAQGTYMALGNFFAHDLLFTATPGIPVQKARVEQLANHVFAAPPTVFPYTVEIAIPDVRYEPSKHIGAWSRASPEEVCHAAIFAAKRDLDAKKGPAVMNAWRRMFRNVPFRFIVKADAEELYWYSAAYRERERTSSATTRWSAVQRTVLAHALSLSLSLSLPPSLSPSLPLSCPLSPALGPHLLLSLDSSSTRPSQSSFSIVPRFA